MIYQHHGIAFSFSGCILLIKEYHEYFGPSTDIDALAYLTLANFLIHNLNNVLI